MDGDYPRRQIRPGRARSKSKIIWNRQGVPFESRRTESTRRRLFVHPGQVVLRNGEHVHRTTFHCLHVLRTAADVVVPRGLRVSSEVERDLSGLVLHTEHVHAGGELLPVESIFSGTLLPERRRHATRSHYVREKMCG